jgi:hypothetical protein
MYRDPIQRAEIRKRIINKCASIRRTSRETGISRQTIRKIVKHPTPPKAMLREYHRLGPHTATIRRLLEEDVTLTPSSRLSVKAIHQYLRSSEGFTGSYSAVRDYVAKTSRSLEHTWSDAYDLIASLDKAPAIDCLFMLSRVEPPVVLDRTVVNFMSQARQSMVARQSSTRRETETLVAYNWMHTVLQNAKPLDQLSAELGDFEGRDALINSAREGRLSERNKALTILAIRRGIRSIIIQELLILNR